MEAVNGETTGDVKEIIEEVDRVTLDEVEEKKETAEVELKDDIKPSPIRLTRDKGAPVNPLTWGQPGELSDEEAAVYEQFKAEVEKRGGDFKDTVFCFGEEEGTEYALCRWLRARKFKIDLVLKMVEEATECRADAKKHNFYPDPKAALGVDTHIYISNYPQLYHGNAKNGCPIFISKPGKLNINAVECITTFSGILRYHWYAMMHDFAGRLKQHKKVNKDFKRFECVIILDLGDLSVTQLNSRTLAIIKEQSFIDSLCFPETMNKMIIVNAPRFFSTTWKVIKGWLDPRTANKIEIIASRKVWEKKLLEFADAKDLPSDYGGTAQNSDLTILKENTSGGIKRTQTDLLSIRASSSTIMQLSEGEKMDVFVYCKAKSGATFTVTDADNAKKVFAANVDVTFQGGEDLDNESPASVSLISNLAGPGKFKVKGASKSSRVYTDNYLVVFNVYDV